MVWLVDVLIVGMILIAALCGIKNGFFNKAFENIIKVVTLILSVVISVLSVQYAKKFGVTNELKKYLLIIIGDSSVFADKIGITCDNFANYLSIGIIGVIMFVSVCFSLSNLNKWFFSFILRCRENSFFRLIDGSVGMAINCSSVLSIILIVFGVLNMLSSNLIMQPICNALISCPIAGAIYQLNPLSGVLGETEFVNKIVGVIASII